MKTIKTSFSSMLSSVDQNILSEVDLSFAIANRLASLLEKRGMSKKEFATAIGCRPSEVTRWLSGEQNFTIRTLARLQTFFGEKFIVPVV